MIILAGGDGFFGAYLQKRLVKENVSFMTLNHRFCLYPENKNVCNIPFELSDKGSLYDLKERLKSERVLKIIYLIAAHNPDFVRENPLLSAKINGEYYRDFLNILPAGADITLYYVSSDTVYGKSENGRVFCENDETVPINLYGEQKLKAESITLENGFGAVRCSYMFMPSLTLKKHFYDTVCDKLKRGETVSMFTDYIRNALTYEAAADLLIRLMSVKTDKKIFNLCADTPISKYQMGLFAAESVGADSALVLPATMDNTPLFSEQRAKSILMSDTLLKQTLKIEGDILW